MVWLRNPKFFGRALVVRIGFVVLSIIGVLIAPLLAASAPVDDFTNFFEVIRLVSVYAMSALGLIGSVLQGRSLYWIARWSTTVKGRMIVIFLGALGTLTPFGYIMFIGLGFIWALTLFILLLAWLVWRFIRTTRTADLERQAANRGIDNLTQADGNVTVFSSLGLSTIMFGFMIAFSLAITVSGVKSLDWKGEHLELIRGLVMGMALYGSVFLWYEVLMFWSRHYAMFASRRFLYIGLLTLAGGILSAWFSNSLPLGLVGGVMSLFTLLLCTRFNSRLVTA